jgi:toxin CcdB
MSQFEVFENPITRARRAYPLVAVLQSDLADTGRDRMVAPLAPRTRLPGSVGRLTPHVTLSKTDYVLLIPSMTAVLAADLRAPRGDIMRYRTEVVAALDYLFLGV